MQNKNKFLSLDALSIILLERRAKDILEQLESYNIIMHDDLEWKPLAGGRMYATSPPQPVLIEGIECFLSIHFSRDKKDPNSTHINGFKIHASDPLDSNWAGQIKEQLSVYFELTIHNENSMEVYERGTLEQAILVTKPEVEPSYLLLHRRSQFRN